MKYFIDTHDKAKGSFPAEDITDGEFIRLYQKFEKALEEVRGADLGAHVNVNARKAFCLTKGPDSDAIRRAHEKLDFPFDSITEVRRVTGVDLRPELDWCFANGMESRYSQKYAVAPMPLSRYEDAGFFF